MRKSKKNVNIEVDKLSYLFMQSKERMLSEADAISINISDVFWDALRDKLQHGELLNITVRGEVRLGKSTVGIKVLKEILLYIEKIGLNKGVMKQINKFMFSDQIEFLRFIDSDHKNVAILIDEFNRMGQTGLNSTTEEALFDYYSDVFPANYIHRISCSPDMIQDKNSNILLDVIGKDDDKKITRCKLTYRNIVTKQAMVLGIVDIYVGDIIANWERYIKPLYSKQKMTEDDEKFVEEWKQKDFYVAYQVKKYKRFDLYKKHGVRDLREPEFSVIILDALKELQDISKKVKASPSLIIIIVDEVIRRHRRLYSTPTKQEIALKVKAISDIYTEINRFRGKRRGTKTTQPSPDEVAVYDRAIATFKGLLERRIEEQEKLAGLYEEYINIR